MIPKLLLTTLIIIISSGGYACSCIPEESISNSYKNADFVFEGKVIKIDTVFISDTANIISQTNAKSHQEVIVKEYFAVKFIISRIFKGKSIDTTVTVLTNAVGTACGYQFALNLVYIVYGYTEQFSLIDGWKSTINENSRVKPKTLNVERYSTNSCTRTTMNINYEISELKSKELIK
ncbi:MAG TPA: hypothetical protein VK711_15700 [Puia sp.]|jgi:hypothetical protein|nr:hypothetical protein [Puia sp.]